MNLQFSHTPVAMPAVGCSLSCFRMLAALAISACVVTANVAAEDTPAVDALRAPMVEMEAKFVRATAEQMRAALNQAGVADGSMVFVPEQAEKALASLKKSGAEFFSNPRTLTRNGRRATVEAVRELRYPTEWEPSKTELGKFLPTSFETRNVGVTLEFEPRIAPDGAMDIDLVPQVVKFRGFVDYSNRKPGTAPNTPDEIERLLKMPLKEGGLWQPIFTTQKVTTSASIHSGQTVLIKFLGTVDNPSEEEPTGAPGPEKTSALSNYVFITARTLSAE